MIRVLIVDDEKIVRKGLVSFMPWQDFGMTVVGDVSNGEDALQFISTNEVDLLLTDLSMPLMSGIELMKEVRAKYPYIQVVVLTLHQEFEYIQEALRLGAIDYIAKTQLEKEQFEDVLGRIASLLAQKAPLNTAPVQQDKLADADDIIALYALNPQTDELLSDIPFPELAYEADIGIWCWIGLEEQAKRKIAEWKDQLRANAAQADYMLVSLQQLNGLDRKAVLQLLRAYRKGDLFYDYDPSQLYQHVNGPEIMSKGKGETAHDTNRIKEKWLTAEWLYDDALFEDMAGSLKALRLPPIRLTRIFFSITDEWNRLYRQLLPAPIVIEDFMSSWFQFEQWLRKARTMIKGVNTRAAYSEEIQNSIMKAVALAQQMMSEPLTAGDMAEMVNMSSSYFSQCFKEIVGQTYTDYLREIRMQRARQYLRNTTKTIQWIAEQVGYNDEKYFSRLFREQVGMLPSEYRQSSSG
ncbi:hypothetical protein YSY43_42580 [Paenibacillus sp. YSY-4.3]